MRLNCCTIGSAANTKAPKLGLRTEAEVIKLAGAASGEGAEQSTHRWYVAWRESHRPHTSLGMAVFAIALSPMALLRCSCMNTSAAGS